MGRRGTVGEERGRANQSRQFSPAWEKNKGNEKNNGSLCPLRPRSPTRWPAPRTRSLGPGPAALPPVCSFKPHPRGLVGVEHPACTHGLGPYSPLCLSHVGHGCHTHTGQSAKGVPGGTLVHHFAAHLAHPFFKGPSSEPAFAPQGAPTCQCKGRPPFDCSCMCEKLCECVATLLPVTGYRMASAFLVRLTFTFPKTQPKRFWVDKVLCLLIRNSLATRPVPCPRGVLLSDRLSV